MSAAYSPAATAAAAAASCGVRGAQISLLPPHTSDGAGEVECESGLKGPLGPTFLRLMAHMENSEDGRGRGERLSELN